MFALTLYTLLLTPQQISFESLPLDNNLKKKIVKGTISSKSKVTDYNISNKSFQKLDFSITGLHLKPCQFALVKLSQYEQYKNYLDFVSRSDYDIKNKRINFTLETKILPTKMGLNFILPRITDEGVYPFEFDMGFLKGLKGKIFVSSYKNRCLFHTKAKFDGPHTGYPNFIFEIFSSTLSKVAMSALFRISKTLK